MYTKYYKNKHYKLISKDELLPVLQKKFSKDCNSVWAELDLKTNKFILTNMSYIKFRDLMRRPDSSMFNKIKFAIRQFIEYKLKIQFYSNRKTLNSELIKQIAMRCLVNKESKTHIECGHKYEILYGIIHSKGLMQPICISDNVGYVQDLTQLLGYINPDRSKEIWDIWMKSKFRAKDRKAFHKACEDQLISMIKIK